MLRSRKIWLKLIRKIPFLASLLALLVVSIDFGFDQTESTQKIFVGYYRVTFLICIISIMVRYFDHKWRPKKKVWLFDLLLLAFLVILLTNFYGWPEFAPWSMSLLTHTAIGLVFIREFSALKFDFRSQGLNPAQIFILSFFAIIVTGTLLLLLPNATHTRIGLTDALFTSTSAVCVTGLTVVDTGTYFTFFGQIVILLLIQLGGLGIMTFTSYFSYFFRGESSYENNLLLREITSTEKVAEVFSTLKKIILITFLVEAIGAILIYGTLDNELIPTFTRRVFFSVFHSVSGFCNAGFSTLPESLFTEGFRFNYSLHLAIAFLFILGGLGFPIVFNFIRYLRYIVVNRLHPFHRRQKSVHLPWVININTRIVIITTGILLIAGTLMFLIIEYDNSLSEHQGVGKIVTAFFSAATPRTAGFNTVDTSTLGFSAIVLTFFLMWVGASPGSTGGGIKTSTLALMVVNIVSLAKGKDRIEIFKREISNQSVRRAFAIIALSFLVIGVSAFLIASVEPEKKFAEIIFESLSAFSTVGLSRGITGDLNSSSKIILIFTMFIGRVSLLTILIALTRKVKHLNYRYPGEEILIN